MFHIFTFILLILHGYITNSQYDQLPVGLIAQLVEHCPGIAEVMGSNPVQAWIVFFRLSNRNCSSCVVTARIFLLFDLWSVVQIYVSYIYIQNEIDDDQPKKEKKRKEKRKQSNNNNDNDKKKKQQQAALNSRFLVWRHSSRSQLISFSGPWSKLFRSIQQGTKLKIFLRRKNLIICVTTWNLWSLSRNLSKASQDSSLRLFTNNPSSLMTAGVLTANE